VFLPRVRYDVVDAFVRRYVDCDELRTRTFEVIEPLDDAL